MHVLLYRAKTFIHLEMAEQADISNKRQSQY